MNREREEKRRESTLAKGSARGMMKKMMIEKTVLRIWSGG
jgi:hypothetical protein